MTVRAIGLDISMTATGLALPDGSTCTIRPVTKRPASRLHELVSELLPRLRGAAAIDLAVLEDVPYGSNPRAMISLAMAGGVVRVVLFELDIPYVVIGASTLKLFACGSGHAAKADMVEAAKAAGGAPNNDDEADAFWLRQAALDQYGGRYTGASRGLPKQRAEILARIQWPAIDERRSA